MSVLTFLANAFRKPRRPGVNSQTAKNQVERAYLIALGRKPDAEGMRTYSENIAAGRLDFLELVMELLDSEEHASQQADAVRKLYEVILCRQADESGLQSHLARLRAGDTTLTDIAGEFIASEEFASKFSMQANVARKIVETLMVGLTGRNPGPDAIDAYGNAMTRGYSLDQFLAELRRSPEFGASSGVVAMGVSGSEHVPVELAILAQELIAAQLTREGSVIGLPPTALLGEASVSTRQMAMLIRTMSMLGVVNVPTTASAAL